MCDYLHVKYIFFLLKSVSPEDSEKKRANYQAYRSFLNREGPKALGSKEIPQVNLTDLLQVDNLCCVFLAQLFQMGWKGSVQSSAPSYLLPSTVFFEFLRDIVCSFVNYPLQPLLKKAQWHYFYFCMPQLISLKLVWKD